MTGKTKKERVQADHPGHKPLSIVVLGASGDLAKKKIFPALFSLHSQDLLPENVHFFGLSRTEFSDEDFRRHLMTNLTCRYVPNESCEARMNAFLSRCYYVQGEYDSMDAYLELYQRMRERELSGAGPSATPATPANRLFYMAIPPFIFMKVARAIGDSGLVNCGERREGWSRAVIEKPFGHDRASSDDLVRQMASVFSESQTYRIDHYLGKELIQNVMALRFANRVFEPLWNREHIESVSVSFSEDFGVEGRAGYFDKYGIVRDVMQNHLLQILSLLAMERPAKYDSKAIRDEKVRVLRAVRPLTAGDFVLGQYVAGKIKGQPRPGYKEAKDVAPDSRTPTFAAAVLGVDNERWRGVPFLLAAGKALESRRADIHIRFRPLAHNIYDDGELAHNELVIRVQPDEAILLRINNKAPGQDLALAPIELDLRYARAYPVALPEAYESLLLDVVVGDKSLFIRSDELAVAWDIFTPALHEIEERRIEPEPYAYGSAGPEAFQSMRATWRLP